MKAVKSSADVVVSSSDQYYDDCPICRAMREAEESGKNLDPVELAKALDHRDKL